MIKKKTSLLSFLYKKPKEIKKWNQNQQ
jgi:hypothetical protein